MWFLRIDNVLHTADALYFQIVKYTELEQQTGVTKDNQTLLTDPEVKELAISEKREWQDAFYGHGINDIKARSIEFVTKRQWTQHDTTKNLTLALCSEVGELTDVIAWSGDIIPGENVARVRDKIAQELADVIILLVRLAHHFGVEFSEKK